MNPRQKFVLLVGILLVGLAALYPPWNFVDQYFSYSSVEVERFAGYSFFFAPPAPNPPTEARSNLIATVSRIDARRLAVEWVAIVLVTTGLLFLLRSTHVPIRTSGPPENPLSDTGSTEAQKASLADAHPPANASANLPNETAKPPEEIEKLLEFFRNADPQEFRATTAAIFRDLKLQPRHKEDVYFWLVENRHRFAGLVYGDEQPRDRREAVMVAHAKRLMPDLEKHFRSIVGNSQEVASANPRVAPHWAIAELLDEQVDLDALAEEAKKEVPTDRFLTEHDPILFLLDRQNPQLPPWLPEEWERPLSPQERAYWFDLLLRFYSHSFTYWPPRGDKDSRLQGVVTALYHMYRDSLLGALPPPSLIDGK